MKIGLRVALVTLAAAAGLGLVLESRSPDRDAELQFQLASLLYDDTRYQEALEAYRKAAASGDTRVSLRARMGLVRSALRVAEFDEAHREATVMRDAAPRNPEAIALHADALWSAGLFDEAEAAFREALAIEPELSRGRHGLARSLASQRRLADALNEAQAALKLAPRDGEIHHTVGAIYEKMHRFDEAAGAYTNFMNLLPNRDRSDKALWSRAQIRFLDAFRGREPLALDEASRGKLHTIAFRLDGDKVVVQGKVNGGRARDFVLDTGSELTTISRETAEQARARPITYTLSAGVGEVGLRGLMLTRMDTFEVGTLKVSNVPAMIKNPGLTGLPRAEIEAFSPLALGLSMTIDYASRQLIIGESLPEEAAGITLPMRLHRLAMVRGKVNDRPGYFVVDTGGEVISISQTMADALEAQPVGGRKIGLRVYGTSGWDRDAFLLQGLNLRFSDIAYDNFSVVVLNLRAPSVLLGFQVSGIVGHRFLSPYRVSLDLERSEVRMTKAD
ncbi:MAG: retroviral-like aspartic protease family protein [Vicinamibacterales bacterium]|nr:retroviral-like aspartic protease family protein [Vicinamibacterales bacterium]